MSMEYIEVNPDVCNGKPVIKGTRITVKLILDLLANGWSIKDIMEEYDLSEEQVKAAIKYAGSVLERMKVIKI